LNVADIASLFYLKSASPEPYRAQQTKRIFVSAW
jgi:hypothetical protein